MLLTHRPLIIHTSLGGSDNKKNVAIDTANIQ